MSVAPDIAVIQNKATNSAVCPAPIEALKKELSAQRLQPYPDSSALLYLGSDTTGWTILWRSDMGDRNAFLCVLPAPDPQKTSAAWHSSKPKFSRISCSCQGMHHHHILDRLCCSNAHADLAVPNIRTQSCDASSDQ